MSLDLPQKYILILTFVIHSAEKKIVLGALNKKSLFNTLSDTVLTGGSTIDTRIQQESHWGMFKIIQNRSKSRIILWVYDSSGNKCN